MVIMTLLCLALSPLLQTLEGITLNIAGNSRLMPEERVTGEDFWILFRILKKNPYINGICLLNSHYLFAFILLILIIQYKEHQPVFICVLQVWMLDITS